LTYQVDALRSLMVVGGGNAFGLGVDYLMQIVALVILVAVATKLYPSIVT
jgi:ABC-2 type transport system permease protein